MTKTGRSRHYRPPNPLLWFPTACASLLPCHSQLPAHLSTRKTSKCPLSSPLRPSTALVTDSHALCPKWLQEPSFIGLSGFILPDLFIYSLCCCQDHFSKFLNLFNGSALQKDQQKDKFPIVSLYQLDKYKLLTTANRLRVTCFQSKGRMPKTHHVFHQPRPSHHSFNTTGFFLVPIGVHMTFVQHRKDDQN